MKLTDTFTIKDLIDNKLSYLDIVGKLEKDDLTQLVDHKSNFIREEIARIIDIQYLYLMEEDEDKYIRELVNNRLLDESKRTRYSKQDIEFFKAIKEAFKPTPADLDAWRGVFTKEDLKDFKIFTHDAVTIKRILWPENDLYSDIIAKSAVEINKNLQMTTLQDLINQGQATCVQFVMGATGSGPVQTVSWGGWAGVPIKNDQSPVEKIQTKASGPVICSACNEINEYAEPNQKDGTYICYNCK